MITLHIGDIRIGLPPDQLAKMLDEQMPAFISGKGEMPDGLGAIRTAGKAFAKALLFWWRLQVAAGRIPAPMPNVPKGQDVLEYTVRYFLALAVAQLQTQEWRAQYVELDDGSIEVTGLVSDGGLVGAASDAAPGAAEPTGDELVGALREPM